MNSLVAVDPDWARQLESGLAAMALPLDAAQRGALLAYLGMLAKWNRSYNLSAVRDPSSMVRRHLLDSLSILTWVDAGPVLDIGTGAGLPGIPLAIARPRLGFSLLDSNSKKTRFVQQVVGELGLANVEVIRERAERLARPRHYARITSRAFAGLAEMVIATRGLLAPGGRWLAMKGTLPEDELSMLPADVSAESIALEVPGEPASRHLVIIRERA